MGDRCQPADHDVVHVMATEQLDHLPGPKRRSVRVTHRELGRELGPRLVGQQPILEAPRERGLLVGTPLAVRLRELQSQLEPARLDDPMEGPKVRHGSGLLVAGDRGLRGAGPLSQLGLGQAGKLACPSDQGPDRPSGGIVASHRRPIPLQVSHTASVILAVALGIRLDSGAASHDAPLRGGVVNGLRIVEVER